MEKTKAKCAFCGMHSSIDVDLRERMRVAMEATLEKYDSLEFLIFHKNITSMMFLAEAMRLKRRHPEKEIMITKVSHIDAKYGSSENIAGVYYIDRFTETLPLGLFDKITYAAEYTGKAKTEDPGYLMYSIRAYQNWVYAQSDIIFSYVYPDLPETETTDVDRLENKKDKIVISLASDKTAMRIRKLIGDLDEREQDFIHRIAAGDSCKQIGRKYGITGSAVNQAARKAARKVRTLIGREYLKEKKANDECEARACGIFALGEQSKAYIYDIDMILKFLSGTFGVGQINVAQSDCFSETIGPVIARSTASFRGCKMVAVMDAESTVDSSVSSYCPPYDSMACIGVNPLNETSGQLAVYEHIIENSEFIITDTSELAYKDEVIAACAKYDTILIDVANIPKLTKIKL